MSAKGKYSAIMNLLNGRLQLSLTRLKWKRTRMIYMEMELEYQWQQAKRQL